jgi:hypothetical protein
MGMSSLVQTLVRHSYLFELAPHLDEARADDRPAWRFRLVSTLEPCVFPPLYRPYTQSHSLYAENIHLHLH